jgi:hypothetical protein
MTSFRIRITDEVTQTLVDGVAPRRYVSPPQPEEQARSLIGLLLGPGALEGTGPGASPSPVAAA